MKSPSTHAKLLASQFKESVFGLLGVVEKLDQVKDKSGIDSLINAPRIALSRPIHGKFNRRFGPVSKLGGILAFATCLQHLNLALLGDRSQQFHS